MSKQTAQDHNLTYEDGFAHGYEAHRAEQAHEVKCNPHPDAPHGFMRNESHSQDRYVCECEYWTQPSWQGLSDDEVNAIANKTDKVFANSIFWVKAFAIAIEQALKEKNNG